jgi:U32 family peptidase
MNEKRNGAPRAYPWGQRKDPSPTRASTRSSAEKERSASRHSSAKADKKPELLAPAGKFESAYYAFAAGADGVYLGLEKFSARKAARNFSRDALCRLKTLAEEKDKKIYVAVNTVILEEETGGLIEDLLFLEKLRVDGVIVQEPALAELIKKHFPSLPVHASTQMAVNNAFGLAAAKALGIRRVILPRELTLEQIKTLKQRHPDIEFETFIHGSLCYCFSGLCLASARLAGRSGNRGECAQVCRSDYEMDGKKGFYFSCRDLFLGEDIRALAEAGVSAFKIEGRLRSPEYVYYSTAYYRYILDHPSRPDSKKLKEMEDDIRRTFLRTTTQGYLGDARGGQVVNSEFPAHLGAELGTVEHVRGKGFTLRLLQDISLRDGALFFEEDDLFRPHHFSIRKMQKGSVSAATARKGEKVTLFSSVLPAEGQTVFHHSSHLLDLKSVKETAYRPSKLLLDVSIELDREKISIAAALAGHDIAFSRELTVDWAREENDFSAILTKVFQESGESGYAAGRISLENRTGLADNRIFIPPSEMKKIKNEFYEYLGSQSRKAIEAAKKTILDVPLNFVKQKEAAAEEPDRNFLSRRANINVRYQCKGKGFSLPFVLDFSSLKKEDLACSKNIYYLPLDPLCSDEDYFNKAKEFLNKNADAQFLIGLNNVGHLELAKKLEDLWNVRFFIDYYLYVANIFSFAFFEEQVRPVFQYFWTEGKEKDFLALKGSLDEVSGRSLVRITDPGDMPLFISKACFVKNNGLSSCGDCRSRFSEYSLSQGRSRFKVIVYNCMTYFYMIP